MPEHGHTISSPCEPTLLTPSFGNHLFAYHLVLKHPHTNMIIIIVIHLHSKSRKKCHKNFENRFINKNLTSKNVLDLVFYMCKGGNPKILFRSQANLVTLFKRLDLI